MYKINQKKIKCVSALPDGKLTIQLRNGRNIKYQNGNYEFEIVKK